MADPFLRITRTVVPDDRPQTITEWDEYLLQQQEERIRRDFERFSQFISQTPNPGKEARHDHTSR